MICRSPDLIGTLRDSRGDGLRCRAVRSSAAPRRGDGRDRHDGERAVMIRANVPLSELAKQASFVSQACKVLG